MAKELWWKFKHGLEKTASGTIIQTHEYDYEYVYMDF